jgi:hypothetical protein
MLQQSTKANEYEYTRAAARVMAIGLKAPDFLWPLRPRSPLRPALLARTFQPVYQDEAARVTLPLSLYLRERCLCLRQPEYHVHRTV